MSKSLVTESPEELTSKAEKDIMNVNVLLAQKFHPEDLMYDIICFHATQAVEKLLKSYIIKNGQKVNKIHDIDRLHNIAVEIDVSFTNIKDDCVLLNVFVPDVKYSEQETITKQNLDKITKSMETVCCFPPIKAMRDLFAEKRSYKIVAEITTNPSSKETDNSTENHGK